MGIKIRLSVLFDKNHFCDFLITFVIFIMLSGFLLCFICIFLSLLFDYHFNIFLMFLFFRIRHFEFDIFFLL
ncbi:MAG: hypothetical protein CR988_02760 [Treponema sp.]|nr:MAG: hypothetical protein CR988_02760 [Treponema sp.]